jgi:hypothetical protein
MPILPSLKSEVRYARDIVKAGLHAVPADEAATSLVRATQSALAPAALGVAIGVLSVYLGRKGRFGNAAVVGGLLGGALGFTGGVAWGTRQSTRIYYQNAAQNVQAVRDAHWLEKNPIAYA